MTAPRATYRLQLNAGFDFDAAAAIAPYLARLGVSHAYLSPILAARAGSTHGYDVIDPTRINPELGGREGFDRLVAALRAKGLGVILDIVPNHMAVGGADNPWWRDVLERGEASAFARWFDIDWRPPDPALHGRVLAPFLGEPFGKAMRAGQLALVWDETLARLCIGYFDQRFPLRAEAYQTILGVAGPEGAAAALRANPSALEPYRDPGRLTALLERQHYRLCWWRCAGDEINWRRFFDINGLAALRMEDEAVFEASHALLFDLWGAGAVDGFRIDHVDGLADPGGYCRRLRARLQEIAPERRAIIVVEKIFAAYEQVARDWGVDGTTGYGFMNDVCALLHDRAGEAALDALWQARSDEHGFAAVERRARQETLSRSFAAALDTAVRAFRAVAEALPWSRDVCAHALRRALTVTLTALPAYRTYLGDQAIDDWETLERAAAAAHEIAAPGDGHAVAFVFGCLSGAVDAPKALLAEAALKFEQVSAPLAAKAVEDTAFYRYGRLLSRNEVGSDPAVIAITPETFHARARARGAATPATLLATATHDAKRGEDVRARLAVLSARSRDWAERLATLEDLSDRARCGVHPADGAMALQMVIGAWPLDLSAADVDGLAAFAVRLCDWQDKALREAKQRSSWVEPDGDYEMRARRWLSGALAHPAFAAAASAFVDSLAAAGAANGLAQTFLRCVAPGVPDCYQGCELWDFSLVDPDNRRPVDYAARRDAFEPGRAAARAAESWRDGRVKQALIGACLGWRRSAPTLFARGDYTPLQAIGPRAAHVLAFVRQAPDGEAAVFAVALGLAEPLRNADRLTPDADWWGETRLAPPGGWRGGFDPLAGARSPDDLAAATLFATLPVAARSRAEG